MGRSHDTNQSESLRNVPENHAVSERLNQDYLYSGGATPGPGRSYALPLKI